jgi:hypothetical protein
VPGGRTGLAQSIRATRIGLDNRRIAFRLDLPLIQSGHNTLRPTKATILWVPGDAMRPGREADYSPLSNAELRMNGVMASRPLRLVGVHRDDFIFPYTSGESQKKRTTI